MIRAKVEINMIHIHVLDMIHILDMLHIHDLHILYMEMISTCTDNTRNISQMMSQGLLQDFFHVQVAKWSSAASN